MASNKASAVPVRQYLPPPLMKIPVVVIVVRERILPRLLRQLRLGCFMGLQRVRRQIGIIYLSASCLDETLGGAIFGVVSDVKLDTDRQVGCSLGRYRYPYNPNPKFTQGQTLYYPFDIGGSTDSTQMPKWRTNSLIYSMVASRTVGPNNYKSNTAMAQQRRL